MASQNVQLISEYSSIEQQLAPLQNSENQMHELDRHVAAVSDNIRRQQGSLKDTQKDNAHMHKRIHRNENPRFLHYLVCNREAKVERLKNELHDLVAIEQNLSNQIVTQSAQLSDLQRQQQSAHSVVDRKHQLESRSQALFEQVVDSQPPTQALQRLRTGIQQKRMLLTAEQGIHKGVSKSVQLVQQGLSLFQQAEGLYRRAHNTNERAKQINRAEVREQRRERREEALGNEFSAESAEWNKEALERQERRLQSERDSLINQANDVAMRAYQIISTAFSAFPMEARARYPYLCTSIGQVAFPRVEGACFTDALFADAIFGTVGAAVNDFSSGCKIQNNMRVVEQCAMLTSRQLGQVTAVQSAVDASVREFQIAIQNSEQLVSAERINIFNAVRAAVMQQ